MNDPINTYNYPEYNPGDRQPLPEPKNYRLPQLETPKGIEWWNTHLRLAASAAILSPAGRAIIPSGSRRVRIADNVLNGDKYRAQEAAKAAAVTRQAFPDTAPPTTPSHAGDPRGNATEQRARTPQAPHRFSPDFER